MINIRSAIRYVAVAGAALLLFIVVAAYVTQ